MAILALLAILIYMKITLIDIITCHMWPVNLIYGFDIQKYLCDLFYVFLARAFKPQNQLFELVSSGCGEQVAVCPGADECSPWIGNATSLLRAKELRVVQKFKWLPKSFISIVSQSCVAVQQLCNTFLKQLLKKPQLCLNHSWPALCFSPFLSWRCSYGCSLPVLTIFLGLWLISLFRGCRIIHIKITPTSGLGLRGLTCFWLGFIGSGSFSGVSLTSLAPVLIIKLK